MSRRAAFQLRQRGVATVEMAVALPVLLLLLFATAEIGRAFVQYTTLSNAARNAARYVADRALLGTTGVVNVSGSLAAEARNLVLYGRTTPGATPAVPGLASNHVTIATAGPDVVLTVQYPFAPLFGARLPTFGLGESPSTQFQMRIDVRMRPL